MEEVLIKKLYRYLSEHNPDLQFQLEQDNALGNYLSGKVAAVMELVEPLREQPSYIVEDACMEMLKRNCEILKIIHWTQVDDGF